MGKKKIKTTRLDLGGMKLIEFHTKNMNKNGKLKGKNKKETKVIRDTCMHHKVNSKGKIKPRVEMNGDMAHCTMCGHDFPAKPYTKDERKKIIGEVREFVDHTKHVAAAIGADENTKRHLAEFSVSIDNINKINKECTKIVSKQEKIKNKKKKNKDNDSSSLGSWGVRH